MSSAGVQRQEQINEGRPAGPRVGHERRQQALHFRELYCELRLQAGRLSEERGRAKPAPELF